MDGILTFKILFYTQACAFVFTIQGDDFILLHKNKTHFLIKSFIINVSHKPLHRLPIYVTFVNKFFCLHFYLHG